MYVGIYMPFQPQQSPKNQDKANMDVYKSDYVNSTFASFSPNSKPTQQLSRTTA